METVSQFTVHPSTRSGRTVLRTGLTRQRIVVSLSNHERTYDTAAIGEKENKVSLENGNEDVGRFVRTLHDGAAKNITRM